MFYGISFHNTALKDREPLVFSESQKRALLHSIYQSGLTHEGLVLCTCNRTEIYLYAADDFDVQSFLKEQIGAIGSNSSLWRQYSVRKSGMDAVKHLFTIAAGLDSQMIGESQIIRQIKDAYTQAIECRTAKYFFHRLIHNAFRASKAVRTNTDINAGAVSIGSAAVEFAKQKMKLARRHVLMIGAGENAALMADYLVLAGIGELTVASRTLQSASGMAARLGAKAITIADVSESLAKADLILCSTASEKPVLTIAEHGYLISQRTKPLVIVDIAVPRDVEPAIGQLNGVQLCNLEDLNIQVQNNLKQRSCEIPAAMEIIEHHVAEFENWLESLNVNQVIALLVDEYNKLACLEAERYCRLFPGLDRQDLEKFSTSLIGKVLHGPISYLKTAGRDELGSEQLETVEIIRKTLLGPDRKRGFQ
ncbi:MAG: glutamyl-tRNA reductase [Planctomycetaceae bacterium]|nr:glutamyl-tRNA reductase [Planctomycetaceae bacterium]